MQRIPTLFGPARRRAFPLLGSFPSLSLPGPNLPRPRMYSLATTPTRAAVPFRTHLGPVPASTSQPLTPNAHVFWDDPTSTWTYVVVCPTTKRCVIIDPVLDYDPATQTISTASADSLLAFIRDQGYEVDKILETHAHADHLTSAKYLQLKLAGGGGKKVEVGIGEKIRQTQDYFAEKYQVGSSELEASFDRLWKDGETFKVGDCECQVLHLPGHTADHVGYQFASFCFVGDSIFLPTVGSARADFPFGSAETLFASSQKLLSFPSTTRLFSGHHYPSASESNLCSATVKEQKELNRHLKEGMGEAEFVEMRKERDGGLNEPRLLHQSLQVNIRGGRIPRDKDGKPFLRVPVKVPEERFAGSYVNSAPTRGAASVDTVPFDQVAASTIRPVQVVKDVDRKSHQRPRAFEGMPEKWKAVVQVAHNYPELLVHPANTSSHSLGSRQARIYPDSELVSSVRHF